MQRRSLLAALAALPLATVSPAVIAAGATGRRPAPRAARANELFRILDAERDWLGPVWSEPRRHRLQLLYTRIERDAAGKPSFRHHAWRLDRDRYFWPASLVKLPIAAFALERARELSALGIDRDTPMFLEEGPACRMPDPDAGDSIARSVRRALVVSENPAYSRLFDVVGPDVAHRRLTAMGHPDARIVARFVPCTREENRRLAALRFESPAGRVLARLPSRDAGHQPPVPLEDATLDADFRSDDGTLQRGPVDASFRNFLPIEAAHRLLMAVLFPAAMPRHARFALPREDLALLREALSLRPSDSVDPAYDPATHPDSHVRLFGWGAGRRPLPRHLTVYSKIGEAWGYLSECAYIVDRERAVEFVVSGVGYFNRDGVLNDDRYDYESLGHPFFERVGQVLLAHERARSRRGRFDPGRPWYDG